MLDVKAALGLCAVLSASNCGCEIAQADPAAPPANAVQPPPKPVLAPPPPSASPKPEASAPTQAPCPPEMVEVAKACVDRWEAHLRLPDGGAHPHTARPEASVRYVAQSAPDVYPQAYVNRIEAQAACEAAGKRLCTLGEWFRACKTTKGSLYPYGGKYERSACNSGKPHLLSQLFGRDAKKWKFMEHFNSPALSAEPGFLAKTGEHSRCTNDRGISDMVGNVHEWVSDTVDHELPNKVPLRDDIRDKIGINMGHAIFMGGFYSNVNEHGEGCAYLTPGHGKKYHDYTTGFRCCRDVTPAE